MAGSQKYIKTLLTEKISYSSSMNIQKKLGTILQKFDLNQTQFYQAWSSGTLTRGALQVYANEYGNFIGQLSEGWKTL